MVKLVVFDMAGTTVDEDNLVYKTLCQAINDAGFAVTLDQVLTIGAGKEKLTAIQDVLAEVAPQANPQEVSPGIFDDFKKRLATAYQTEPISPQPGAEIAFKTLQCKAVKVVLNTGYDRSTAEQLLDRLNWRIGQQIDFLVTASDVERGRPFPDMIEKAMDQFGITNPIQVVKIGDSIIDIEEGQQAGCQFNIGVTTGAHRFDQLQKAQPTTILSDLLELIPYLEEMEAFERVRV